jgi:N-acetylneuraminate lyase
MQHRFRGLVAAPFTPFHPDREVNLDAIPAYARLLRDNGVAAAFVCGTTGEGLSMTREERQRVAEAWMAAAGATLPVIVHVGHTTLEEARRLTAHAAEIGAAAVSALAPCFFKPRDNDELVEWCAAVAAAAPRLPFYYYHIPSMTGVALPVAEFLARAEKRIPTLAGIKFTYEDLPDYSRCVGFGGGKYEILFGRDEKLVQGLEHGAHGAVGSTYNYAAPLYHALMRAYRAGDLAEARALQAKSIAMIDACNSVGVTHLAASKAVMAWLGVDCGLVRLPLRQPTARELEVLRTKLEAIGFFEFACRAKPAPAVAT